MLLKNGRQKEELYALADLEQNLLGIIWLGSESIPQKDFIFPLETTDYPTTLAMRIYGEARGKGLAKPFLKPTLTNFLHQSDNQTGGIWIETSATNVPVIRSFGDLGFQQASQADERGKILMVGSKQKIERHLVSSLPLAAGLN